VYIHSNYIVATVCSSTSLGNESIVTAVAAVVAAVAAVAAGAVVAAVLVAG
jgi:hypothetical protein